jgi:hypothetical protein
MFCPRCGSTQSEELKFCKVCGANLYAVRKAFDAGDTGDRIDRSKPWFAEMAASDAESKRRQEELDHRRGIAPEVARINEIKAGVITGSVGLSLVIFLNIFMQGLILSGKISPEAAQILSRLWVVGVIPFLVGLSLVINGVFVSKKLSRIAREAALKERDEITTNDLNVLSLPSANTTEFIPTRFSVTEGTTKHLKNSEHNT